MSGQGVKSVSRTSDMTLKKFLLQNSINFEHYQKVCKVSGGRSTSTTGLTDAREVFCQFSFTEMFSMERFKWFKSKTNTTG